jgi:hypothetical protein
MTSKTIKFIENKSANSAFITINVHTDKVIESWRDSIFSFEWLDQDGKIKPTDALKPEEQDKRNNVETRLQNGEALEQSVLGIGIKDNIEIGSARAEFLTLTALGHTILPVHIPQSQKDDFKAFIAAVD